HLRGDLRRDASGAVDRCRCRAALGCVLRDRGVGAPPRSLTTSHGSHPRSSLRYMAGRIVVIVILLVAPIFICMSGVVVAAVLGYFIKADRDAEVEGTEQL